MGCYDTVQLPCPKCGEIEYAQSKGGACTLKSYNLENAPEDVLSDVNRHSPFNCIQCKAIFEVQEVNGKPTVVEIPYRPRIDQLSGVTYDWKDDTVSLGKSVKYYFVNNARQGDTKGAHISLGTPTEHVNLFLDENSARRLFKGLHLTLNAMNGKTCDFLTCDICKSIGL